MTLRPVFLAVVLWAIAFVAHSEAGCWCDWHYCLGAGVWTTAPGTTVVTTTYGVSATDAKNIDSCPYAGATPPTKICDAQGGLVNVINAEVTGNIGPEYFGFSGTVGQTITVDLKCGGTVTINSWCSCCKTRARIKYKNTFMCGTCACSDLLGGILWSCSSYYCGTLKEYDGIECDEPGCTVPAGCNPVCPPGGG